MAKGKGGTGRGTDKKGWNRWQAAEKRLKNAPKPYKSKGAKKTQGEGGPAAANAPSASGGRSGSGTAPRPAAKAPAPVGARGGTTLKAPAAVSVTAASGAAERRESSAAEFPSAE